MVDKPALAAGRRPAFHLVPPAGAPLPAGGVLASLIRGGGHGGEVFLRDLGVRTALFVSSGRTALAVLLEVMQWRSGRREVVIPAYTCFSVASAVARAGLMIRLCDVDPETLDLDLAALGRLDLRQALAIVPSGLYGLPGELSVLEAIADAAGAFLVDDAAQCLGAIKDARPCGTFGDAGFFSLGRGKGVTTMGGGILVTRRDDLARDLRPIVGRLRRASARDAGAAVVGSLLYAGLLRPSRYWLVDRIPFLELGGSHFDPEFPMTQLSAYQRRLAEQVLPLADAYNKIRRDHADHLRSGLDGVEGISIPRPVAGASPVYLRFPILTRNDDRRRALLQRLRRAGIGASASYPTSIGDIPGIGRYLASDQQDCPTARSVTSRILTLPTHPGVSAGDVERMVTVIGAADRE
jgi:dTDP-4-amino-4,6-dideoxygalactose transaminase